MLDNDVLITVKDAAKMAHTNVAFIYKLINNGLLPVLKLGCYKIRRTAFLEFLEKYEGYDLTNPSEPKKIELTKVG